MIVVPPFVPVSAAEEAAVTVEALGDTVSVPNVTVAVAVRVTPPAVAVYLTGSTVESLTVKVATPEVSVLFVDGEMVELEEPWVRLTVTPLSA